MHFIDLKLEISYFLDMNEKQKDNLAKFAYDLAKITIAVTVITPLAKPGDFNILSLFLGLLAGISVACFGYFLDAEEVANNDNI